MKQYKQYVESLYKTLDVLSDIRAGGYLNARGSRRLRAIRNVLSGYNRYKQSKEQQFKLFLELEPIKLFDDDYTSYPIIGATHELPKHHGTFVRVMTNERFEMPFGVFHGGKVVTLAWFLGDCIEYHWDDNKFWIHCDELSKIFTK